MLTVADIELLTREPTMPGLRMALDADALLGLFAGRWPDGATAPDRGRVDYVRYKPRTSLVAGMTLWSGSAARQVSVKAFDTATASKLAKLRDTEAARTGSGVLVDHELAVAVVDAACDPKLPGVRGLARWAGGAAVEPLRYKPERRWVGRLRYPSGDIKLVKVHRPRTTAPHLAAQQALTSAGLPVPGLHAANSETGTLVYEWFAGTSLERGTPTADQLAEAGALLARLHTAVPAVPTPPPDHQALAATAVDAISAVAPRCSTVAQSAAFSALEVIREVEPARTTVHGDFSADQLIARQAGLGLVDLDRVRVDDPAVDLAEWVAAEFTTERAATDADPVDVLGVLLDGYVADTGAPVHDRLAAFTTLALLRRAVEPFRLRQEAWPERTTELVHTADRLAHASVSQAVRNR